MFIYVICYMFIYVYIYIYIYILNILKCPKHYLKRIKSPIT